MKKGEEYLIEAGYDISEKIIRTIEMNGWKTGDTVYSDKVSIRTVCEAADSQRLIDSIRDITSGKIIPVLIGQCDLFEPLPDEK